MKKVRVLKEMPFAKVGEEFELTIHNCIDFGDVALHKDNVIHWEMNGYLEWVEEDKSLEEKFEIYYAESTLDHNNSIKSDLAKIAKEHYLGVFDKALDGYANLNGYDSKRERHIRKALEVN